MKRPSLRPWLTPLCLLLVLQMVVISHAWAHRMLIFPSFDGETITIAASFSRNAPAVGAKVTVRDTDGNILHQGHTDDKGRMQFTLQRAQKLEVVVNDGAGHRASLTLTRDRLRAAGIPDDGEHSPTSPHSQTDVQQRLDALSARVEALERKDRYHSDVWRYASATLLLLVIILSALLWQRRST
ncbi:MAG: carboxypeptidase regulatory-like domain-containing protein [Planctomycetota bacterium]|nr:MAG: carboxypeptidase regulatory-like domain-containing protein [Planctomycetota bacterium]